MRHEMRKTPIAINMLLCTVAISGCGLWQKNNATPSSIPEQPPTPAATASSVSSPQILLLIFKLQPDSAAASGEQCSLVSRQTFEGRVKTPLKPFDYVQPGDLICTFYDKNGALLSSHVEEDPLTASVEAAEEDGTLKRHNIDRTEAELVLRVQRTPGLHRLVIGKVISDKSIITISEFTL